MSLYIPHLCRGLRGQKKALDAMELRLYAAIMMGTYDGASSPLTPWW